MRKRISRLWLVFCLLPALCLSGCGSASREETEVPPVQEGDAPADDAMQIGMIFDTFVVERWIRDRDVFLSTAQDLGADVSIANANGDAQKQAETIRRYTEQGMDAIVVVAIDVSVLQEPIREAREKGIKVISYDRLITGCETDLYVSFDNREVGRLMGEALTDALEPDDPVVLIFGPKSDNNTLLVEEGAVAVLSENGNPVLDTVYIDEWDAEKAYAYVDSHLDLLREAKGILCGNDNFAGAVQRALTENRLPLPVIVGQDADLDACQHIVEGTQYMTVYKPVQNLAHTAAQSVTELVETGTVKDAGVTEETDGEIPSILLHPVAVTKENINETVIEGGYHSKEEVYLNRPELMP